MYAICKKLGLKVDIFNNEKLNEMLLESVFDNGLVPNVLFGLYGSYTTYSNNKLYVFQKHHWEIKCFDTTFENYMNN